MHTVFCGDRPMGHALATAVAEAGHYADQLGRPRSGAHPPEAFVRAESVSGGRRRLVIGTTGWTDATEAVGALLRDHDASAAVAANVSPGVLRPASALPSAIFVEGRRVTQPAASREETLRTLAAPPARLQA